MEATILTGTKPRDPAFRTSVGEAFEQLFDPLTQSSIEDDLNSHFILRLFCCDGQFKEFFAMQEVHLLKARLSELSGQRLAQFISDAGLLAEFPILTGRELVEHRSNLIGLEKGTPAGATRIYFKTNWMNCQTLVSKRKVLLSEGRAYLNERNLRAVLVERFTNDLSTSLIRLKAALPLLRAEFPFFQSNIAAVTDRLGTSAQSLAKSGAIAAADLPQLAETSFPLCMSELYYRLTDRHRLEHLGRVELQLFLKGIGLSLEGALEFWKLQLNVDNFDDEHEPNIRRAYGHEGKRTDYTPHGCIKLITTEPGTATHGCPFQSHGAEQLKEVLRQQGIIGEPMKAIVNKAKSGHFQAACQIHFKARHPGVESGNLIVMHPNEYYQQSKQYHQGAQNVHGDD